MKEDVPKSGRVLLFSVLALALLALGVLIWGVAEEPKPSAPASILE
jgi:hypothetical protein